MSVMLPSFTKFNKYPVAAYACVQYLAVIDYLIDYYLVIYRID